MPVSAEFPLRNYAVLSAGWWKRTNAAYSGRIQAATES